MVTGLRSLFPWYIAFFIFKPTILMLQTCDFPFCHISLTPARENSLLLLAQVIRLDPPENQVNLILKYIAWLIFAKALSLCNIIYWYVPEIRPQTSQHGVWRRLFLKVFGRVYHWSYWSLEFSLWTFFFFKQMTLFWYTNISIIQLPTLSSPYLPLAE